MTITPGATREPLSTELIAFASGQPITSTGLGERPALHANIEITGKNIPLDDKLLTALDEHKIRPLANN